jgi:pimeloyl-ACP methyl ester carboxylesterase
MAFPRSTYTTSRTLTYSYIHIPSQSPNTQSILFLHGFPSTSYVWRNQISFFVAKGYGILAPDLLGYGETSKPTELEMYKAQEMANDIVEIMTFEGIDVVVGVAHDWYDLRFVLSFSQLSTRCPTYVDVRTKRRDKIRAYVACNSANLLHQGIFSLVTPSKLPPGALFGLRLC